MYLNPNWTEDMYAETSFYQVDEDSKSESFNFLGMFSCFTQVIIFFCWTK